MADILSFKSEAETFYQRFARDHLPDRPTQDILNDLKPLQMIGEEDAIERNVLFAELVVKHERTK